MLQAILKAYKEWGGKSKKPNIAILEFRQPFQTGESGESAIIAELFRREGLAVEVVTPEQLEYRDNVLRRGDFAIDLIFRRVKVQEFLVRFDLSHPLLRAYRDQAVCMVNSFRSELAQKKAIFDLLTDEEITADFPAAERKAIKEFVPWTRVVQETKTKYHNRTVDLPDFILHNRNKLVLRPNDDGADQQSFRGSEVDEAIVGESGALRAAQSVRGAGGAGPGGGCFPGAAVRPSGDAEDARGCAPAFLPRQGAGLFQLADRRWTLGVLDAVGDRADVHSRTEVACCASELLDPEFGPQIRDARGVARIRDGERHRIVHPIVRRAVGVVRGGGEGVFTGTQIATECEFNSHLLSRPGSFPCSLFPARYWCRTLPGRCACAS